MTLRSYATDIRSNPKRWALDLAGAGCAVLFAFSAYATISAVPALFAIWGW